MCLATTNYHQSPMEPVQQLVANVFHTISCTVLIGTMAGLLGLFALLRFVHVPGTHYTRITNAFHRIFTFERCIHISEELSLMAAHILISVYRDPTGDEVQTSTHTALNSCRNFFSDILCVDCGSPPVLLPCCICIHVL